MLDQGIWPVAPLGDLIIDMQPGFARRPNAERVGVRQLRTNNVSNSGAMDFSDIKYVNASRADLEKYSVRKGDVIFNNTNSPELVGRAAFFDLDEQFVISNHMTRLRTKAELLDPQFLARYVHYLWQIGASLRWAKQWVNQAAIDQMGLAQFPIPLPALPEQRRIVSILRKADELRELRRCASQRTCDLLPALFCEMFGDPIKNPKGWPIVKLSKMGDLDRGKSRHRPRDAAHLYGGAYPFIQTGDITNSGGWIETYTQTYSEKGLAQSRLWPEGTLCITIAANIAQTGILTFDACFPDSVVGFIPNSESTVEYVQYWLQRIQQSLEASAPQLAQKNINLGILRNLQIPKPPYALQKRFTQLANSVREQTRLHRISLDQLDELFRSLLTHAFAGELTAAWREAHVEELRAAAAERDRLLELKRKRTEQPVEIELDTAALTDVMRSFQAVANELVKFRQPTLPGLTQLGTGHIQAVLPTFTRMAEALQPFLRPLAEEANKQLTVSLSAFTVDLRRQMLEAFQPLTKHWRAQQRAYFADLSEKLAQLARLQLDAPFSREEVEVRVFEVASECDGYITLLELTGDWRLNHFSRQAIQEAVDMLAVRGQLRPATLKLETSDRERPYALVTAYAPVGEEDLVSADEIEL